MTMATFLVKIKAKFKWESYILLQFLKIQQFIDYVEK